jgi:RimJ/RimL family protein N-acetyltransferase
MILKSDKVSLRPMEPEEVTLIHVWANNSDVMPFWYGGKKRSSRSRWTGNVTIFPTTILTPADVLPFSRIVSQQVIP